MPHSHDHGPPATRSAMRPLAATLALSASYLVAEVVGGLWTGSLALLADAGHMLTDVASLALALGAIWLARRPSPAQRTFGYHRAEILAALANGGLLLAACIWIIIEAIRRLQSPPEVFAPGMLAIATGGLLVNIAAALILHKSRKGSLNLRGVWLHVLTDLLGSIAAIAGALLIWWLGWNWADPLASIVIALLVLGSAWNLVAEAAGVLMESAPRGLDVDEVRAAITGAPGVSGLHDLHIWSITPSRVCLSVHVVLTPNRPRAEALAQLQAMLRRDFGITHTTIQIEPEDYEECDPCELG